MPRKPDNYMTTRQVARYLHLNEKKIYAMAAKGELPCVRISGKWLFPRDLLDRYLEKKTFIPDTGIMDKLLPSLFIIEGSDDVLFKEIVYNAGSSSGCPVAFGVIGSVGGIDLLSRRCVHAATVHFVVDREKGRLPRLAEDHCLINLFARQQGIMFRRRSHGPIASAADVIEKKLSLAVRETSCGTYHLTSMLFEEKGVKLEDYPYKTAPCLTHGEAAGAVASGIADAAVGIRRAADELGLDFAPLLEEDFYLMLPSKFMGEPRVLTLVDAVLDKIRKAPERLRSGYLLEKAGNMVPLPANR